MSPHHALYALLFFWVVSPAQAETPLDACITIGVHADETLLPNEWDHLVHSLNLTTPPLHTLTNDACAHPTPRTYHIQAIARISRNGYQSGYAWGTEPNLPTYPTTDRTWTLRIGLPLNNWSDIRHATTWLQEALHNLKTYTRTLPTK